MQTFQHYRLLALINVLDIEIDLYTFDMNDFNF